MGSLALEDVSRLYGDVLAVDDVSVSFGNSAFHCLLGPNGSGKTTILRLLLGLERPSSGTVIRETETVGCGFQRPTFYPSLSVRENLNVFASLAGESGETWRERLLDALQLRPVMDRPAGELSGGYARKLDLALALLDRPPVVLLDEPLGALDDVAADRLVSFLAAYRDAGNAVVVSTHRATEFESHLDRVTIVAGGQVLLDAPMTDIDLDAAGSLQAFYVDLVTDSLEQDQTPPGDSE